MIKVVLGGASSGKTRYAVDQAEALWQQGGYDRLIYLATAQAHDSEMIEKITRHQHERQNQPWQTDEEPLDVAAKIKQYTARDIVLFDSIGMWLSNVLLAEERCFDTAMTELLNALQDSPAQVILVADEVGQGIVPTNKLGRVFRDCNGKCNQRLCALSERVDFVVAGLVQTIKNTEPK